MSADHRSELTTEAGRAAYEAVREVVWYGVKDRFPAALDLVDYVGDQLLKLERGAPLASETTDAGLDAAWADLADDLVETYGVWPNSDHFIARHRPRIEAALSSSGSIDAERLAEYRLSESVE